MHRTQVHQASENAKSFGKFSGDIFSIDVKL
jgi:hypothetical protein